MSRRRTRDLEAIAACRGELGIGVKRSLTRICPTEGCERRAREYQERGDGYSMPSYRTLSCCGPCWETGGEIHSIGCNEDATEELGA